MTEQLQQSLASVEDSSSILSYSSPFYFPSIRIQCEKLLPLLINKTNVSNDQQIFPKYFHQLLSKQNLTFRLPKTISDCTSELTRLLNSTYDSNSTIKTSKQIYGLQEHSRSLIIFIILIASVSLISVIGNLCLAKVLYSKRYRLIQTDRIVLCLALSELCLVLIDTPTEIYRFLSFSFTQEWLCRFHAFFEGFFSSCIIFYHLLGAFDRFVYIHGHTSSTSSSWSKWCRHVSTKSGSIILLILPIICSFPIAVCNVLHAHVVRTSLINKICMVQYKHGILIGLLISFYVLPLLFSFFLHAKLIYFIRTKHNHYCLTKTAYVLPSKPNNIAETRSKRRSDEVKQNTQEQFRLQLRKSSNRRAITINSETISPISTTSTTLAAVHLARLNRNRNSSSNLSQSHQSSTANNIISKTASPIVLYKINSQANANAKRTILLLVLLLSFYVFCWAPYNIYTWHHAYQLTQSSRSSLEITNSKIKDSTIYNDFNQTISPLLREHLHADLRRIIFINYALYLLSMLSMCFSFIFYFLLNKQARHELSRFMQCLCPWIIHIPNKEQREQFLKQDQIRARQIQYRKRIQNQYPYQNDRMQNTPILLKSSRQNHMKRLTYTQNTPPKRTVVNYGCQIQCCA